MSLSITISKYTDGSALINCKSLTSSMDVNSTFLTMRGGSADNVICISFSFQLGHDPEWPYYQHKVPEIPLIYSGVSRTLFEDLPARAEVRDLTSS